MNRAGLGTFQAAVAAVICSVVVQAQDRREPLEGTWLLDVGRSRFLPMPGPKGQMRTYALADGAEKMTSRGISGEGKPTFVHYEARYDGKDYDIIGSKGGNKISLERLDRLTTQSTQKRGGKPVIVATRRVSDDAKTLTVETHGTLPDGSKLNATMVFQRK
ncbi:MAG TPA: hypothetical protein VI653_31075 [Steroidobacteraceae bacterium]